MSNIELARAGIERAGRWLQGASRALQDERWDDAVYASQMAVEQSAKAVLIALGIDFPKEHDVSIAFEELAKRLDIPEWFRRKVPGIVRAVAELAEMRGLAGYGFEQGIGVEYFKEYAPEAHKKAEELHEACSKLLGESFKT
jgi:HEPN domain-containing protein